MLELHDIAVGQRVARSGTSPASRLIGTPRKRTISARGVCHGLFADLDPKTRAWALERWTPHPIAFRFQPVKLDSFWSQQWKASVIWCRRAPNPGEAHQRRAAERLGAKWMELDTGHYPMLSTPMELTAL